MYESDVTTFIRELLEKQPHIVEDQKKARARWWDKRLDLDELNRRCDASDARGGYFYYDNAEAPDQAPKNGKQ
jgi:hypothetical protein